METTNEDRAAWAKQAIDAYVELKDLGGYQDEDLQTIVTDFVADLRHMCEQNDVDFEYVTRVSAGHFSEELEDES